jgi:TRAP-type uncharacterized transport system substrate-binding protein
MRHNNIIDFVKGYTRYDLKREIAAWAKIAKYYSPILIPAALIIIGVLLYIKPLPSKNTFLAIGQQGSGTEYIGKSFKNYFYLRDLSLTIVNTTGLEKGLNELDSSASKINASFVTAGTSTAKEYPNLVSLGSVQVAPLWLFYRGSTIHVDDPFEYYRDKKIAIGADGTITNRLFTRLMELNNPGTGNKENFLKISHADAAEQLRNGKIDAIFIVNSFESDAVQSLLADPTIKVMDFPLADAYARKLPFLEKVTIPKASIDIDAIRPASDITLLASSVNLLVEKDLHPAIQWAFLMAAKDHSLNTDPFFNSSKRYPSYQDKSFPLSDVASRFYTTGIPDIFTFLPFWLAALLENIWFLLLTLFLVLLPFLFKVIGIRSFVSDSLLNGNFWALRLLEDKLNNSINRVETERILKELESLHLNVTSTWVEENDLRHYFNLCRSIREL